HLLLPTFCVQFRSSDTLDPFDLLRDPRDDGVKNSLPFVVECEDSTDALTPCSTNLTGFRISNPEVILDRPVSTELTLSSVLVRDPFQNQMTVSRPNHLPQRELNSYEVPLLHVHSSLPPPRDFLSLMIIL